MELLDHDLDRAINGFCMFDNEFRPPFVRGIKVFTNQH